MKTAAFVLLSLIFGLAKTAQASDQIPSIEDAGYAYEATQRCDEMTMTSDTTRRLQRAARFRAGRRMFRDAVEQWGNEWACNTALQNLGSDIDLSDYFSGKRVVQPPPSKIPPLPLFKADVTANTIVQATE